MTQNEFYEKKAEAIRLLTEVQDIMDELSREKMTPILDLEKQIQRKRDPSDLESLLDNYRKAIRDKDEVFGLSIKIIELRAEINLIKY